MNSKTFEIAYRDPVTEEGKTVVKVFKDSPDLIAREWAEDFAHAISGSGIFKLKEVYQPHGVDERGDPTDKQKEWAWCMDWCKRKGLAPARPDVWKRATEAYKAKDEPTAPSNPAPFDLKKALGGEPVVLRNGQKAYVRYHEKTLDTSHPLMGYRHVKGDDIRPIFWKTEKGNFSTPMEDGGLDIVGMWAELLVFAQWDLLTQAAQWIAKNEKGFWYSYTEKPELFVSEWTGLGQWRGSGSLILEGINPKLFPECDWKDSLIKRPKRGQTNATQKKQQT